MVEITTIHEQVHDAVVSARERMKATADKKRRDPAEAIRVGQKVWLNLEGIHLNRFNLMAAMAVWGGRPHTLPGAFDRECGCTSLPLGGGGFAAGRRAGSRAVMVGNGST